MHFFKLVWVAGAVWLAAAASAHSAGMCQSFITSWLGHTQPPERSLERSFDDLLEHLDYGTLEPSPEGELKIKSGVHTFAALIRVLQSHGLTAEDLAEMAASLEPLEGRSVRAEELKNGVLRVQLGEELWTHEMARDNARVTVAEDQKFFGIKTLFPAGMSVESIRNLMREFFDYVHTTALARELYSPSYSVEDCFKSPDPEIPPMRLKMVLSYGRPVSFFPTWIQQSCY